MQIFIPSTQRPRLQFTLAQLEEESPYEIFLVVPAEELPAYREKYYNVIGTQQKGIAATRQEIVTRAKTDKVLMMDDDLTFAVRRIDDPTKFREPQRGEIAAMLYRLNFLLDKFAHVGVSTREGGNRNTQEILHCTRAPRVIGYRRSVFMNQGIDFTKSLVQDDFEATLALLTRGYKNGILNSFVQNQRGSGTVGGASTYRTMELHKKSCEMLYARYPDFVTLVEKKTKTAWGGQARTDVMIQWKKAYASGVRTYGERHP